MTNNPTATPIDEYISNFPPETQIVLNEIRAIIRTSAPEASEKISYAIPTFYLKGNLVHFAGYSKHIGFYPGGSGIEAFKDELKPYKGGKGSVQFPLGQPLPAVVKANGQFIGKDRLKGNVGRDIELVVYPIEARQQIVNGLEGSFCIQAPLLIDIDGVIAAGKADKDQYE